MKKKGVSEHSLIVWRNVGWYGSGCHGVLHLGDLLGDKLNAPDLMRIIERALGRMPDADSVLRLRVEVEVVKDAKPLKAKCVNPWPTHRHFCPVVKARETAKRTKKKKAGKR